MIVLSFTLLTVVMFILCTLSAKTVTCYRTLFYRLERHVYIINLLSGNSQILLTTHTCSFPLVGRYCVSQFQALPFPWATRGHLTKGQGFDQGRIFDVKVNL